MTAALTKVLVWKGKHGSMYFDASTPEVFAESCLELMRIMDEQRWYYIEDLKEVPDIDIDSLPEPYRTDATKNLKRIVEQNREANDNNETVLAIRKAVAEHDVSLVTYGKGRNERTEPAAWALLRSRSDYEYEGVTVERVWAPDPS
jgi:hypothetical protein